MSIVKLKPCPFCGGKIKLDGVYILGHKKNCYLHNSIITGKKLVPAWNRRKI